MDLALALLLARLALKSDVAGRVQVLERDRFEVGPAKSVELACFGAGLDLGESVAEMLDCMREDARYPSVPRARDRGEVSRIDGGRRSEMKGRRVG
jgi:hypothetical protein